MPVGAIPLDSGKICAWPPVTAKRSRTHRPSLVFLTQGEGFFLLSAAWRVLYDAQRTGTLAPAVPYARVRNPQYVAFVVIMFGFLPQWPTLITNASSWEARERRYHASTGSTPCAQACEFTTARSC